MVLANNKAIGSKCKSAGYTQVLRVLYGWLFVLVVVLLCMDVGKGRVRVWHTVYRLWANAHSIFDMSEHAMADFVLHWQADSTPYAHVMHKEKPVQKNGSKTASMRALVATQTIAKGSVIAIYPVQVVAHLAMKQATYALALYDQDGKVVQGYSGYPTSKTFAWSLEYRRRFPDAPPPIALFSNEPAWGQHENAALIFPRVQQNVSAFSMAWAVLVAKKTIVKGEEIVWCYGPNYHRDYATPCATGDH